MSDTQGADDTASGGLQNDMPGLGNDVSSSPSMPPQGPLGGLANFARQALGIGRPAPRSATPGRSPFQFPGQSQVNPPQGGPPPSPNAPRWEGTTASLAIPRGSLQPQAKFSKYMPTLPSGQFRQWGQPQQFGAMPQSFELGGIAQSLSRFFGQPGQGGSAFSVPLALGMGKYAGEYMKAFSQGQEYRSKMMREKWLEYSMELQYQQEQRHTSIADIIGRYAAEAGTDDPAKLIKSSIKGVSLRDALYDNALKTNDTYITSMLEDGVPVDRIMRYQDLRDSRLKDLQKVNKKATEQEQEDAGWQDPTGSGDKATEGQGATSSSDPFSLGRQQGAEPTTGAQTSSAKPAPTMSPNQDQGEQQADPQWKTIQGSPDFQSGLDFAKGGPADALPKGADAGRSKRIASEIQKRIDNVLTNSQGKTDQQISNELRAISPAIQGDYDSIGKGRPVPGGFSQVGSKPYWSSIVNMKQAVNPGWTPEDAGELTTFLRSYDTGPISQQLIRGGRMGAAGKTVLEAEKRAKSAGDITNNAFVNKWNAWRDNNLSDRDPWAGVFNALQTYVSESMAVANGGKPYEGDIRRLMDQQWQFSGPRVLNRILQEDAENTVGTLDQLKEDWAKRTHKKDPPYHYNERQVGLLRGLTHLQSDGSFDGTTSEIPDELQSLGGITSGCGDEGFKLPPGVTITPLP